jgi:uncharacterized damage-inducible protein DinB
MMDKPITQERLLRILDGQASKTEAAIAGLDEAAFDLPARHDGWTAKEVLGHIASAHEAMLALAQGAQAWSTGDFDLDAVNEDQRQRTSGMALPEVLTWLEKARASVRAYILEVSPSQYDETVHTPWMGDHPKGQFLMYPALHEGGHRVELEAWRSTLTE